MQYITKTCHPLSLKMITLFISLSSLVGCYPGKNIQAKITEVRLIKIDTIYRFPDHMLRLTWRDINDDMVYVSCEPIDDITYRTGLRMIAIRKK